MFSKLICRSWITLCCLGLTQMALAIEDVHDRIDGYLTRAVDTGFSGAILVAKDGNIIISKGYGWADQNAKRPNRPDTVFDIGSNTKQFTAAAILKLVEQGKLRLNDTLPMYFQGVPADKKGITVHNLLTHGAGLVGGIGADFDPISEDDFLEKLFATQLHSAPGSKYRYSNVGYSLLALIVERVSGQAYEDFLYQNLFAPVGMTQTGYLRPNWPEERIAHGYKATVMDVGTMVARYKKIGITPHLLGNGGIQSTLPDLYKWCNALKQGKVLKPELRDKLFEPALSEGPDSKYHYGYGWVVGKSKRDTKMVFHNGANPFYYCEILWFIDEDLLILYATNARTNEAERVVWDVQKVFFDPVYKPEMKPSVQRLVWQFMDDHQPSEAPQLRELIPQMTGEDLTEHGLINRIGYDKVGQKDYAWAVALFELNASLFPEDGNLRDSLGEGYFLSGQMTKAAASFETALKLAPADGCSWCSNSQSYLEKIRKQH